MSADERARAQSHASRRKGWRIAARLRVIIAAPLVAVLGFAGLALAGTVGQAQQARRLDGHVMLAADAGVLAYSLSLERAAAADLLTRGGQQQLDTFNQQAARTDGSVAAYQKQWAEAAGNLPGTAQATLDRVRDQLARLGQLREQIRFGQQISVSATAFGYRILIADLLSYRDSVAQSAAVGIADDMRAAGALAEAIESVGQQQVAVVQAVASGQLTPATQSNIIGTRAGFTEASLNFLNLAPATWRAWWERASTGPAPLAAGQLQDQVARAATGEPLPIDITQWISVQNGYTARLFEVEQQVDGAVRTEVEKAGTAQVQRAGVEAALTTLALLLTILVTTVVARQITRRLRRLRDTANEVAFNQLPAVVDQLREADPQTVRPEWVADQAAPTPERVSADEIGEVVLAFAHVHRAAVRTAAEQAVMRANMADIFVHLSRREQRLVDAVLAQVDEVERDETNPQRLENLYKLDNLATRMARINSSLLVLGGAGAGRVRHEDVPLVKVLQAALSQIEHYTRVRMGMIDDGVAIAAEAVDEIVHLIAELLDNATLYSPPDTDAWMTARSLTDRVVVQIGDEGVGLPAQRRAELNVLLTRPPAVDAAAVRAMGLTVAGHLAVRYGIRVDLRPGPKLGTIAEINIPLALTRSVAGVLQMAAASRRAGEPTSNGHASNGHPGNGHPGNGHPGNGYPGNGLASNGLASNGHPGNGPASKGSAKAAGNGGLNGNGRRPASTMDSRESIVDPVPSALDGPMPQRNGGVPRDPTRPGAARGTANPAPVRDGSGPAKPTAEMDTEEIPIFQSVSGWFRAETGESVADWRTAADEVWQQAQRATAPVEARKTTSGLPVRIPRQHLVPGGVDGSPEVEAAADVRDPDRVSAAMAAYARGVASRRPNQPGTDN